MTDKIMHDFAGEFHQRYDSPEGGLLVVGPDGYIGFWGQFGATLALTGCVRFFLEVV